MKVAQINSKIAANEDDGRQAGAGLLEDELVEGLRARIVELEDQLTRFEANAADIVAMADELGLAKHRLEVALETAEEYRRQAEELARIDPLTQLSNRREFEASLDQALSSADRRGSMVGLLLFDLDRFKAVNDTYGHPVGDALLKFFADSIMAAIRETDCAARLGGDEFAVVLTDIERPEMATRVANRIIETFAEPVVLDGSLIKTGTSAGISVFPRDGRSTAELMQNSDKALYEAKSCGRGTYQFFAREIDEKAKAAHSLDSDLRLAIVRDEFVLFYQPQRTAIGHRGLTVEALVRWEHPANGLVGPDGFIQSAEESGLIHDIGKLVLQKACRQCAAWQDKAHGYPAVAVNISPVQFGAPDFVDTVRCALVDSGLAADRLELEITENVMITDVAVFEKVKELHALGIRFAVDDFGSGYSSLAHLKRLPVDILKIDRQFVSAFLKERADYAIVEAILNMAHSLDIGVIAEGVETQAQASALQALRCDGLQGFLIGRPMPEDRMSSWLAAA